MFQETGWLNDKGTLWKKEASDPEPGPPSITTPERAGVINATTNEPIQTRPPISCDAYHRS